MIAGMRLSEASRGFRERLQRERRPANTISAYLHDLSALIAAIGDIPVKSLGPAEIAAFLGRADSRATRKRRITTLRRFVAHLREIGAIDADPTTGVAPSSIVLREPQPLSADEQERLLAAAAKDVCWSLAAIWLMTRAGLTRGELLALRRGDVTVDREQRVTVRVLGPARRQRRSRSVLTDPTFTQIYEQMLERCEPIDELFPVGFQAVNGMVDRVRRAAGLPQRISPQTLRETFIVTRMQAGWSDVQVLEGLGMADETQNRRSIARFRPFAERFG